MKNEDKLTEVSMKIILHAGNARNIIREIGKKIGANNFDDIDGLLSQASQECVKAHKAQTDIIQAEARGEVHSINILFSHAQDTLMTTQSELFMIETLYNYAINKEKNSEKNTR